MEVLHGLGLGHSLELQIREEVPYRTRQVLRKELLDACLVSAWCRFEDREK